MIELGGNITLDGFHDRDYAELIVVKKLVGRYARQISDEYNSFTTLAVSLTKEDSNFSIDCKLVLKEKQYQAKITNSNLFVALDSALKQLVLQL